MDASTKRTTCTPNTRQGFTLVELLTVIVIIGILVGLVTVAAIGAISRAREFTIKNEITQLSMALETYKTEHGQYPPDFADAGAGNQNARLAVLNHIKKAFPRCQLVGTSVDDKWNALNAAIQAVCPNLDINQLGPSTSLVFWLGGPPANANTSTKLLGFSANPANPFAPLGSRLEPPFEFDQTRLYVAYDNSGSPTSWPLYIPPHMPQGGASSPPYVYFRAYSGGYDPTVQQFPPATEPSAVGYCVPYGDTHDGTVVTRWIESKKYQIICSGRDGLYSTLDPAKLTPQRYIAADGGNITIQEDDNLTSFTTGRLEDGVQ